MRLLYDSRCPVCKTIAFKLHFASKGAIALTSLHSQEAKAILDAVHPRGWAWDFYFVTPSGKVRRGLRSLPSLVRLIGPRQLATLAGELGTLYSSKSACSLPAENVSAGRRALLKAAMYAPVVFGTQASLAAALATPVSQSTGTGAVVNIAEVFSATSCSVWECAECRVPFPAPDFNTPVGAGIATELLRGEDSTLVEQVFPSRDGVQSVNLTRTIMTARRVDAGVMLGERQIPLVAGGVRHARFDLSMSFATDRDFTSAGGMCQHDVPEAVIDYVMAGASLDGEAYLWACANGVRALGALHAAAGRERLTSVYEDIALALEQFVAACGPHVAEFSPLKNKFTITSLPDLLQSTAPPDRLRKSRNSTFAGGISKGTSGGEVSFGAADAAAASALIAEDTSVQGCDDCSLGCCCDLGACLGCGCGYGACIPPLPFCGCGLCGGVSCGCGLCCGTCFCS